MSKKQFSFFAAHDDLVELLKAVASKNHFRFARADNIQDGTPYIYQSVDELVDISISIFGDQNREKYYLLIDTKENPKVREVEQRKGGVKYILDQLSHPESVVFKPGGLLKNSDCIIAGQIGTVSNNEWSKGLYNALFTEFNKRFTKIKSFYVGKNAARKLDEGFRLTTNIKSPLEYDLQY